MTGQPGRSGGRNATPPALRVVKGSSRRQRNTPPPPVDHDHAPDEPDWAVLLPGDSQAAVRRDAGDEWSRVVPVLDGLGMLVTLDRALLVDYCMVWARMLECERRLSVEGLVVEVHRLDRDGNVVRTLVRRNPYSTSLREYRTMFRGYLCELGLGPSSRGRISVPGPAARSGSDLL